MSEEKKSARDRAVTFYAKQDVKDYLDALESGEKSDFINQAIRAAMTQSDTDDRLTKIEKRLDALEGKRKH